MSSLFTRREAATALVSLAVMAPTIGHASARATGFKQAVAEASARDKDLSAFYRANDYQPIWTGRSNRDNARRQAFLKAIANAGDHGLPAGRYDPDLIKTNVRRIKSERDLGRLEVEMSRLFLLYARDVQTGILNPRRVDTEIDRRVPLRDRKATLVSFANSSPQAYVKSLPPKSADYTRLMKEKIRLEREIAKGGWGQEVPVQKMEPGATGARVVALRNRLIRLGYMNRSASQTYDDKLRNAVATFQRDHGLNTDGIAGKGTLTEVNRGPEYRLGQVVVAMERERWMNFPGGRGDRHVYVNLADFRTKLYDNGKVTFETRSVIGERHPEKRSPEFSDKMEYLEINPDWTVPRSVLGRDYLPKLQKDPNAAAYLELTDDTGRRVSRDEIDFTQYTKETFPFTVRQPPGRANALGTVKFMFPNKHAIYLHDTPQRHLFARETRAFSAGCIRLHDPHDFAYVLLRRQMREPEPYFQRVLASGQQTIVPLEKTVPVHLDYRTAFTEAKGKTQFRRDVYGRDAKILRALQGAGVSLRTVRS